MSSNGISAQGTAGVRRASMMVRLWNRNLGQEAQHNFSKELLCWWMRLSKWSYTWFFIKGRKNKNKTCNRTLGIYLWVATETMIDYWSWTHWLKESALASGWKWGWPMQNNRRENACSILQRHLILLKMAKKIKVFLENKGIGLCIKIFF